MFVNVSPVVWNVSETMCSLNFAKRCRSIKLGKAKRHAENPEVVSLRATVEDLKARLSAQKAA